MAIPTKDPILADHLAWLGYVQPEGLVVSAPALKDSQVVIDRAALPELQRRFAEHLVTVVIEDGDTGETAAGVADLPRLFTEFLGWPIDRVVGMDATRPIPSELSVSLPEFGESLAPTYAVTQAHAKESDSPWLLLVQVHSPTVDFDKPTAASSHGWHASPAKKFERLLRESQIPIGLLTNGVAFRLVYAPPKENSGALTFPVGAMAEVSGRLILGAFHLLLNSFTLFNAPTEARLPGVLQLSRDYQASVSEKLAEQVLHALYELLRGFEAADSHAKGKLLGELSAKHPEEIYGGFVTVLLRLVFVLFAEDRGLLPMGGLYVRHYSVRGLFERLRTDSERHPDTMDLRYGAWAQLLALFRLIHGGCDHPELKMPAREGHLFDPDRFPFLEGRSDQRESVAAIPLVSDGVLCRILEKLCILDAERVSYRTLDVEEIGSVYQTIMGFGVEIAAGTSVALKGKRKKGAVPAAPVINLDALLLLSGADRITRLVEEADTKLSGDAEKRVKEGATVDDLLAVLEKRIDRNSTPAPVSKGGLVLQPNDERRRSGSHYTPRSFTAPIVRKTLAPVLGSLTGLGGGATSTPTPAQILELKIADIAVGSAAFLVETCRQLGDALVAAWRVHGGRPPLPPDETEELLAMRLVAQRCLYGVDRNPMAVDLAKLSLWLVTLAKDHPFTFLDHNIRCGDSLVGLTQKQIEAFSWEETTSGKQRILGQDFLEKRIKSATSYRKEILEGGDYVLPALKAQKLVLADEAIDIARFAGDLTLVAFFASEKDSTSKEKLEELREQFLEWREAAVINPGNELKRLVQALRSGERGIRPFHWDIEFPEVFARTNGGFDAIIGNPPFVGGKKISGALGKRYANWLSRLHVDSSGNADLVAHFFRRAFTLNRNGATAGLIATNTISQGDTRRTGLRFIIREGCALFDAVRRQKWPGSAAVVVSVVCFAKGTAYGPCTLDGRPVEKITAFLFHAGQSEDPSKLAANAAISYIGCDIKGQGFLFDDDDGEASPTELMRELVERDRRNAERIRPYIGAEELNDEPRLDPRRWVISFDELSEAEARRWPDLLAIVEKKVRPERAKKAPDLAAWPWWRFWRTRQEMYSAISSMRQVLVCPQTSKYLSFVFMPPSVVFSHKLVVFADSSFSRFCCLQSRIHQEWADFFGSSMKDDPVYTPSDCFETFPFPDTTSPNARMDVAGRSYYDFRARLMAQLNVGLTSIYNRFHDPDDNDTTIKELRELHQAMDRAVLDAYGWTDLVLEYEFGLDYEEDSGEEAESKGRKRKKPWRYRLPDTIRDEVLARLLKLNAECAERERLSGASTVVPVASVTKSDAGEKPGRKPKRLRMSVATARQLPTELRFAESDPSVYAVGLVVALLSEAGGALPWSRLLDAFVLATQPKQLKAFAPPEYEDAAEAWASTWNEEAKPGDLLAALDNLTGANIAVERSLLGIEFALQDGPKRLPPHLGYDAWLALRVAETLAPGVNVISSKQRNAFDAKVETLVA